MCTLEKRGNIFVLTLTGQDEHRLNPTLLDSIQSALRRVRSEATSSPSSSYALITTAQGKFFSNGYDLAWAQSSPTRKSLLDIKLQSLVSDLICLPLPTIAAVSGHASAAGCIFALSHDYVFMRKDRGFLYMSEMDIKLVIPAWFLTVIRSKIGSGLARRDVILRAAKVTAEKAVEMGIIDSAYDSVEETVRAAVSLGDELVERKWDGYVYARNRMELFSDLLKEIGVRNTGSRL